MIAGNEMEKSARIFEIKRQRRNIDMELLGEKAEAVLRQIDFLKGYTIELRGLDLKDI